MTITSPFATFKTVDWLVYSVSLDNNTRGGETQQVLHRPNSQTAQQLLDDDDPAY